VEAGQSLKPVSLELLGVSKSFKETEVLRGVSLTAREGEFISLLGPSGCGKTTTLNIIAGFLSPDKGEVRIDGTRVNEVPPHKRRLAMVFQNYALFPHMTIFENVAFGLRMRGEPPGEIGLRVKEALNLVHLSGMEERYPRQLSGGQQQRVGLARALAVKPRILLLDEPLSNLDAKLRKAMQMELRTIQQYVQTTTIYVTHDQEEAFMLSDRVMVMNSGIIEQGGSPEEIYSLPRTEFVAEFIGVSNFLDAVVAGREAKTAVLEVAGKRMDAFCDRTLPVGTPVRIAVRPDRVTLQAIGEGAACRTGLTGRIAGRSFAGAFVAFVVDLGHGKSIAAHVRTDAPGAINVGDEVAILVAPADWLVLDRALSLNDGGDAGWPGKAL
jgi:spermidine/putrescine transport system ATP-binding protein